MMLSGCLLAGVLVGPLGPVNAKRPPEVTGPALLYSRRMQRSSERFLTTHTGSLPRPDDLIRMMYAKEEGVSAEQSKLSARVKQAVAEVVQKQAAAGIDLINDGEMSKPSYATYIK